MPQPKKKTSNSKTGHRRAHWINALALPNLTTCPQCHAPKIQHTLCASCMTYKGRSYGVPANER